MGEDGAVERSVVTAGTAGAPYRPGLLALREGQLLLDGFRRLLEEAERAPDVDAAGAVGLRTARAARTPEPLRVARQVARQARAATSELY